MRKRTSSIEKEIFQKNFKKFWRFKKMPYLCVRFPKESLEEEFFERFRYKQASSTSFVWNMTKKQKPSILETSKETDSVLEQIKTFSDENT